MTITNHTFHIDVQEIQHIFLKYDLWSAHPIDYQKFVEEIHKATTVVQFFTSDSFNLVDNSNVNITVVPPT